jgi:hypothetical protein
MLPSESGERIPRFARKSSDIDLPGASQNKPFFFGANINLKLALGDSLGTQMNPGLSYRNRLFSQADIAPVSGQELTDKESINTFDPNLDLKSMKKKHDFVL